MARFNTQPITGSITAGGTVAGLTQNAFTELTGTAPYTVTLPSPVLYPGYNQTFYNATSGTITLSTPANNFTGAGGSGTSTVIVPTSSTINIISDGTNYVVVGEDGTSLTATTGAFSGNVTINGAGATLSVTPQTVTINPGGTSTIDNINIGATTRGSGAFTTLAANGAVTFTAGTASSSTGTGTLVVTGGIGASGNIYAGGTVSANALSGPLTGTIQTAAQPNITSLGNLTALNVTYTGGSIYTSTAGGIPRLYIGGGNGFGFNRQTASEDIFFNEPGDTGTFRIRGAGTISLGVGNTTTSMTIGGNGGNIGINKTSPSESLYIERNGSQNLVFLNQTSSASVWSGMSIGYNGSEYFAAKGNVNTGEFQLGGKNASGYYTTIYSNNAETVRIQGGYVGIALGSVNPVTKLHVGGAGNTTGGNIHLGDNTDTTAKWTYLTAAHYNGATNPTGFALIGGYGSASANSVVIGGSIYETNPATEIQFWTHTATTNNLGGTQRMNIDTNGNVGIGVVSGLTYKLQVNGNALATGITISTGGGTNVANTMNIDTNGSGMARYYSHGSNTSTVGAHEWHLASSNGSIDTIGMTLSTAGNLTVAGTATANSDITLKTNVTTITNALDKVLALRGVMFDRISTGNHEMGVIAQEVELIIPELVLTDNEGIKSVAYSNTVALLIEAIKEQQIQIEELKKKVS
jgi:hypothetical protein